jgi:hypothetical protein
LKKNHEIFLKVEVISGGVEVLFGYRHKKNKGIIFKSQPVFVQAVIRPRWGKVKRP